jgi:serine/threonine protein kinase
MYIAFKHPNILKARELFFFKKEQYLIIVFEYCSDGNLSNFIGKLDQKRCKDIMKQLADGVVYLHEDKKLFIKTSNLKKP